MDEKSYAWSILEKKKEKLAELSDEIWSLAEVGMQEYESSKTLIEFLADNGFEIEQGVAKMPTAFVATYGSGKPVIGIDAEYDARDIKRNGSIPKTNSRWRTGTWMWTQRVRCWKQRCGSIPR